MSILSDYAQKKESKGNALQIGKEAREAKALNPNVIDSTIGMLYDENGKFLTFKSVEAVSLELSDTTSRVLFRLPARLISL